MRGLAAQRSRLLVDCNFPPVSSEGAASVSSLPIRDERRMLVEEEVRHGALRNFDARGRPCRGQRLRVVRAGAKTYQTQSRRKARASVTTTTTRDTRIASNDANRRRRRCLTSGKRYVDLARDGVLGADAPRPHEGGRRGGPMRRSWRRLAAAQGKRGRAAKRLREQVEGAAPRRSPRVAALDGANAKLTKWPSIALTPHPPRSRAT